MKGEWRAAGKEAGTTFGCIPVPAIKLLRDRLNGWGALGWAISLKKDRRPNSCLLNGPTGCCVNAAFANVKGATLCEMMCRFDGLDACSSVLSLLLGDNDLSVQQPIRYRGLRLVKCDLGSWPSTTGPIQRMSVD